MSNESMLQKDFKSKDVQRLRNIVSKKYGNKTVTQTGYVKKQTDHVEGDVWEENGKTWTIKNGLKQTQTRFDAIKKSVLLPLMCPECGHIMKTFNLNKKLYSIHGKCSDCVIKYETQLKFEGKFEEYQRNMIMNGVKTHIKDLEEVLLELSLNDNNGESIITENGDVENWVGGSMKAKIMQELQGYIKQLKDASEV
jgi:hypothetical protein